MNIEIIGPDEKTCDALKAKIQPIAEKIARNAERNRIRRETNQMLRDITGTSARAAREDMGLSRA